ncbi:hypothetical protein [Herbaspirillum sp. YR522]|uniref:hypothetical protein n=1 Tax=Herbaspirillum sp. YR522 TaxID=1144342 RepID=UPI00026F53AC|nr:hypothetical protein [Herbaspirillum sp. YR522]EJN05005.1 hypothetical protein PMI40_02484 [Herbaspirillum sp. YR522]
MKASAPSSHPFDMQIPSESPEPARRLPVAAGYRRPPHRNAVPRQLIQQQLLREALYPGQVRAVVEQLLSGQDRGRELPPQAVIQVARHIDANRRAGRQALPLVTLQELHAAAEDAAHPLQHDARLLLATALGAGELPLHEWLAAYLKKDFELDGEIAAQPDSRTYNSHLPSIALRAQDYGTVGRTLMTLGAAHLFASDLQPGREQRLSSVMWSFDKCPQGHPSRKTFMAFYMDDPLESGNAYEK